jgi:hypothetical protein
MEIIWMNIFQTQFLNEICAGHDGPVIPESKRVYFQERFRGIVFDFLINLFVRENNNGLTKAKLARRIGKSPEVINRWLGAPSNLTLDSVSDLLLGICAEELTPQSESILKKTSHAEQIKRIAESSNPASLRRPPIQELNAAA